jgi:hypothetical protein
MRIEDCDQQVVSQASIKLNPALNEGLEPDVTLEDKEGPDLLRGECGRGKYDIVIPILSVISRPSARVTKWQAERLSEVGKRGANFRLKEDDDREAEV